MRISMVDEKTYLIGDKEFIVGDPISLVGINVRCPASCLAVSAEDLNLQLTGLVADMRNIKAAIIDHCRNSDAVWSEELRRSAFNYEEFESELGHGTALLYHAIQRHLDAPLPLRRNIDTGQILVAARAENFPLNYTKSWAMTKFKIATLDLLATFADNVVNLITIPHDLNHALKSPVVGPLLLARSLTETAPQMAQFFMDRAKAVYDSSSKMPTPLIVVWVSEKGQFVFAPSGTTLSEPKLIPKALGKALTAAVVDFRSSGAGTPGIYVLANVDGKTAALGVDVSEKGLGTAVEAPIVPGIDALLKGLMKE